MGKVFNIVFMSSQGSGNIYSRTYFFDWSKLPQGQYTGTFSFTSAAGSISPSCVNIFVDLGFGTQYSASTINGVQLTTSTFYIGSALTTPYGIIGNSYLSASIPNNPPFTLLNRPSNNNVNVRILNNDANQTNFTTELVYTLVLSLELQE